MDQCGGGGFSYHSVTGAGMVRTSRWFCPSVSVFSIVVLALWGTAQQALLCPSPVHPENAQMCKHTIALC